jgi:hypothetical protein
MGLLSPNYDLEVAFDNLFDVRVVLWDPGQFKLEEMTDEAITSKCTSLLTPIAPQIREIINHDVKVEDKIRKLLFKQLSPYLKRPQEAIVDVTCYKSGLWGDIQFYIYANDAGAIIYELGFGGMIREFTI